MTEAVPAEELLARMARRDVDALAEVYDRYAPRVYGLVAHILAPRHGADEVLQELFLRLWSESPRLFQEGKSVGAWLVVTARAAAVERLRKKASDASAPAPKPTGRGRTAKPASASDSPSLPLPASPRGEATVAMGPVPLACFPHPAEISLIDERLGLLHKVLGHLPKAQQQALELAMFRGLSETEIAAELGEPLGKVRTSLRAAVTFVKHRRRAVCGTWAANI